MSLAGYFSSRNDDLRMAKGKDPSGIEWKGPVLSGRMGVREAQELQAGAESLRRMAANGERPEERYRRIEDYDAVLRAHCGLGPVGGDR